MSRPATLDGWLAYLETLHPKAIALGLERVNAVHARLEAGLVCPVVTVAGTNGKGSTCAMLESVLRAAGYRTGLYTSPHLTRYNERVCIAGKQATDEMLLAAFEAVEDARCATLDAEGRAYALTYFEFGTLAALWLFARAQLDVVVLEVGLGGRLDAVNIVEADVAVLTSVGIDHVEYLGPTREDIGREKAGIFRTHRPAVVAEPHPPATITDAARSIGASLTQIGRDFGYVNEGTQWRYWGPRGERFGLPFPALRGAYQLANAATVLVVLDLLHVRLPVSAGAVRTGLLTVALSGRFQVLPGRPVTVLDVAHNPLAARVLADELGAMGYHPRTLAVCAMLADKDIEGVAAAMAPRVDEWFVAGLPGPRGATREQMSEALQRAGVALAAIRNFDTVGEAGAAARNVASETDRIVIFGSFLTVAAVLPGSTG